MKRLTALLLLLLMLTGCTKQVHKPIHNPPQTDPPVPVTEKTTQTPESGDGKAIPI